MGSCACPLPSARCCSRPPLRLQAGSNVSQLSCGVMEQACQHGRADAAAALLSAGLRLSSAEAQRLLLAALERRDGALMAALLDGGEGVAC